MGKGFKILFLAEIRKGWKCSRWNPWGDYPKIDNSAYIDPTVVINR